MEKINFEAGTIVTPAKVNEDKTITPAVWEGKTPLSPFMLNKLQENIENDQIEQNTVIDELKAKTIKCLQEVETPMPKSGTSIDLSDSAEMRCDLKISGNSKQETRSGKNKLKITSFVDRTTDGVTFTAKFDIKGNLQYINAVGNSTTGYRDIIIVDISNLPAGNYKINGLGADKVIRYVLLKANDTEPKAITTNTDVTFTQDSSSPYVRFRIDLYQAGEIDCQIKPMIRLSSETDNTYEPYGASPSPDYTSEVECCGDNINLFDGEIESGNINSSGVNYTDSTMIRSKNYTQVKPNKDIIITNNGIAIKVNVVEYDKDYNFIVKTYVNATKITTNSQTNYIKFVCSPVTENKIKIEHNSTPTPFSPYGQGCINEVICNDNLFDKNNLIPYTIIPRSNGVAITNNSSNYEPYNATDFIPVKENTNYFINFTFASSNYGWCFYDKNKNFISGIESNVKSFATPKETAYLRFCYDKNRIDTNTIQLVEGSTEKPYVEHKEQIYTIPTQQPFRSIGDIRDTFIKKNNKWYERHWIPRIIFDGTENWFTSVNSQFELLGTNYKKYKDGGTCISSHFIYSMELDTCVWIGNSRFILIRDTRYTNVNDWKSYLAEQYANGTPVYVDYILETPLDIECTEEQSTILFDIEENAKTYDKVTHMYSTDNVSSYKDVTYKKDLETLFANTLVEGV